MLTILQKSQQQVLEIGLLKAHLRIIHDSEDNYLQILIEAATDILEKAIGVSILKKKYHYTGTQTEILPIGPVTKIYSKKEGTITFEAGLSNNPELIPADLQYAILQIAKNMYEGKDENMLESKYIQQIIKAYKPLSIF